FRVEGEGRTWENDAAVRFARLARLAPSESSMLDRFCPRVGVACAAAALVAAATARAADRSIDFNRQIRPILSDNCFACHGPDEKQRKAKLRLDTKGAALAELRDGGFAIVPGRSAESDLIARIGNDDPSTRMPPPKTGKRLTPVQI